MKFNLVQKNVFMVVLGILSVLYFLGWWTKYNDIWGLVGSILGGLYPFRACGKGLKAEYRHKVDEISKPSQEALHTLFGAFAPIAPYGVLIGFALAVISTRLLHMPVWLGLGILVLGIAYQIWLYIAVSNVIKKQKHH